MNNNDLAKGGNNWVLIFFSLATFICGAAGLFFSVHIKSNLPSSGEGLDAKAIENLLIVLRIYVTGVVRWMSVYMIILSIVMWRFSRKNKSGNQ